MEDLTVFFLAFDLLGVWVVRHLAYNSEHFINTAILLGRN